MILTGSDSSIVHPVDIVFTPILDPKMAWKYAVFVAAK